MPEIWIRRQKNHQEIQGFCNRSCKATFLFQKVKIGFRHSVLIIRFLYVNWKNGFCFCAHQSPLIFPLSKINLGRIRSIPFFRLCHENSSRYFGNTRICFWISPNSFYVRSFEDMVDFHLRVDIALQRFWKRNSHSKFKTLDPIFI